MYRKAFVAGLAMTAVVGLAGPSFAHHSTNLWYDMSKTQTVEGTIVQLKWINPHSVLEVMAPGPDGQIQRWEMETHGNAVLARAGWRPNMFKPGDKVTVIGNPSRKGLNTLSLLEVKTQDGKDYKVNPSN